MVINYTDTFYPAGSLIAAGLGYDLTLLSIPVYAVIIAVSGICVLVFLKYRKANKLPQFPLFVIMPLSYINAVFLIFNISDITMFSTVTVMISVFVTSICGLLLMVKHVKASALKNLLAALYALMIVPVFGFVCFVAIVGSIGEDTIVNSIENPSGRYTVQVIDSNQGALGGATIVDVREKGGFNAGIFKIVKIPERVYTGRWGEFENMDIYWKDDSHLVINAKIYEIKR